VDPKNAVKRRTIDRTGAENKFRLIPKRGRKFIKKAAEIDSFDCLDIKKQTLINIVLWCLKSNQFIK